MFMNLLRVNQKRRMTMVKLFCCALILITTSGCVPLVLAATSGGAWLKYRGYKKEADAFNNLREEIRPIINDKSRESS